MEIVAPVSSMECTRAALRAGADAVYCSGKRFHAREFCDVGCTLDELKLIREVCSRADREYFLVFNAFPSELDWQECVDVLDALMTSSPNAVIISSIGLIRWVKNHYDVPVIVSVLAGTWDEATVEALSALGASAVTISRGAQIGVAEGYVNVPMKAVAHGNSCSLLDGTCRLGSFLGGVSGRLTRQCRPRLGGGSTATNPCRQKYSERDTGRRIIFQRFPIQFCALSLIPRWNACGVKSLKINGRTNTPDWIRKVVEVYREAVDSYLESPLGWEVKSEWLEALRSLVPTERLETMPDPIWELSLHEHH